LLLNSENLILSQIKTNIPMKNLFALLGLFMAVNVGVAQTDLNYYLPKDVNYDINIPTHA